MYTIFESFVVRNADNSCIPFDENNRDYAQYLSWVGDGGTPKRPKIILGDVELEKIAAVQRHMDKSARIYCYDDIKTAVTYAEEPAVPKFQAEGLAFRAWRSLVWAKCYEILDEVNAGTREILTDEEFISELPELIL